MNNLEKQIRAWWGNQGESVSKDELIDVLLQLLDRVQELEAAQEEAARYRNALVGMMACTLRADCPADIYDAAEKALKGDV